MRTGVLRERTGATARQVVYWTRRGWLTHRANGPGTRAEYDEADLRMAQILVAVSKVTDAHRRRSLLETVGQSVPSHAYRWLVATPDHVWTGDHLAFLVIEAGGAAVVVDLHAITGASGVTPEASGSTSETVNRLAAPAS